MVKHIEYLKECLRTNLVGDIQHLTSENREEYKSYLNDDQLVLKQAVYERGRRQRLAEANRLGSDDEQMKAWIDNELPPIHIYRTSFEISSNEDVTEDQFEGHVWNELREIVAQLKNKYESGLANGVVDHRVALESPQRAYFKSQVDSFNQSNFPDTIPSTFAEARCNVFGHVCPVFFAAEALTETRESRRIGRRQISFATMMRIVRRDDYRCQHCKKKLRDDEVEFDHIIPVSKGGSSEEYNLRLTCFECNRDKSDEYTP
jgi:hypothetical protein